MPILPEFMGKRIMLHVTPKSPTSVYVGMPMQKAFQFDLDQNRIKNLCSTLERGTVFSKMGMSTSMTNTPPRNNLNQSFSGVFWNPVSEEKNKSEDLKYTNKESFESRCEKFYKVLGSKVVKFTKEIKRRFKMDLNLQNQLDYVIFMVDKWEKSEEFQKKVKTIDEEKNYLQNEYKNIKKENTSLQKKNHDLLFENSTLKSQNELLLEEKNYFINNKRCFEGLAGVNEQDIINKSSSMNIGKTKMNSSVLDMLTDRSRVRQ